MNWLTRHATPLEALAALITAGVALAALIAIPWQIRATARLQAEQSARDIYREFIALSVQQPQFAAPEYCTLKEDPKHLTAYSYYVEYLLYTADQVTDLDDTWDAAMASHLEQHAAFFCDEGTFVQDNTPVTALIMNLRSAQCATVPAC